MTSGTIGTLERKEGRKASRQCIKFGLVFDILALKGWKRNGSSVISDRIFSFLIMGKCIKPTFVEGTCQSWYTTKYAHLPEVKKIHEENIT